MHRIPNNSIPNDRFVLIIGAMKSGTTSLYSYLAQHPEICGCSVKEPEFFSQTQSHGVQGRSYRELWHFDPETHVYALEGSTGYTKYPREKDVPKKISREGLDPRFIYIFRDPFERIESHYNSGRFNSSWNYSILDPHLISVSNYYMQLVQYLELFRRENILLLDFTRLKTEPRGVLTDIYDFLQLDRSFYPRSYSRENPTVSPTRWEILYRKLFAGTFMGRLLPRGLKRAGKRLNARANPAERRLLSEDERTRVRSELQEDMRRLRDEFGVNVAKWGF